jgi:hypothetical protein
MTRSILAGLLGLFSIAAVGALPLACQSGGIGDPCIPEDEYNADFTGFKVTAENIESRSFQCSTRICLVNHFQGRVTCPLGQAAPTFCGPKDTTTCEAANLGKCVEAASLANDCDPAQDNCPNGTKCDPNRKVCACTSGSIPPDGFHCVKSNEADASSISIFKSFVCHKEGNCQQAGADPKTDLNKSCCVPGTDTPTTSSVCGQCVGTTNNKSHRSAEESVYCSCRCGVADNAIDQEPGFNFCECPTGFECSQVRPDVGLGDHLLTGKYCIKADTKFLGNAVTECGHVDGHVDPTCEGSN